MLQVAVFLTCVNVFILWVS